MKRSALEAAGVLVLCASTACGDPGVEASASDGGEEPIVYHAHPPTDATLPTLADVAPAKQPWNRMEPHEGAVLPSMHLRIVYIGQQGIFTFATFVPWLLSSAGYWSILQQYGVGFGIVDGVVSVPSDAFFLPGMVVSGLVSWSDLDARILQILHPDMGADSGAEAAADASADAAVEAQPEGGADASVVIPPSEAYLFFLPDGVNVTLDQGGVTCAAVGGYHYDDGAEPYAVIPPCSFGRSAIAISHELAEMATDPIPGEGWFSDMDQSTGGEVGDLCNFPVVPPIDGWSPTELWSNADGDCEPH